MTGPAGALAHVPINRRNKTNDFGTDHVQHTVFSTGMWMTWISSCT